MLTLKVIGIVCACVCGLFSFIGAFTLDVFGDHRDIPVFATVAILSFIVTVVALVFT